MDVSYCIKAKGRKMKHFRLSTREDWLSHWQHSDLIRLIPEKFSYEDELKQVVAMLGGHCKAIELGGYPGNFSIYLTKYCGANATLLDFIVDRQVIERLLKINDLPSNAITLVEADVFSYQPAITYDLVCSFGFIEHFTDLEQVVANHLKFLKLGGLLLVTLPNFRGVNGVLQKIFDPKIIALHNLAIMDLTLLRTVLSRFKLKDIHVQYCASTQVWIEGCSRRSFFLRVIVRIVNKAVGLLAMVFGKRNRWFSNSIVILAKKTG